MSKSLGNFITIDEALKDYTPNDLRLFILSSHYRSPLDYSEGAMSQVVAIRERVEEAYRRVLEAQEYAAESGEPDSSYLDAVGRTYGRILESLCSDLNTPETISSLIELTRQINAHLDKTRAPRRAEITTTLSLLSNIFEVLGLKAPETRVEAERLHQVIQRLLAARESLRRQGNYAAADLIRTALREAGVEVEDTAQGPRYRLSR
jgi:cysteinyl-tRNA synthetase